MNLQISYTLEQRLKSLSERLKYQAHEKSGYREYNDADITSDNITQNIASIITQIILRLKIPLYTQELFEETISKYNLINGTSVSSYEIERLGWIRYVHQEALIPTVVGSYIHNLNSKDSKEVPQTILDRHKDIVGVLRSYQKLLDGNYNFTIQRDEVDAVVEAHGVSTITISNLVDKEILKYDENSKVYLWRNNNNYIRFLRNEIFCSLWLSLCNSTIETEKNYNLFFRLVCKVGLWPDDLNFYLNQEHRNRLCLYTEKYLQRETDLLNTPYEFNKCWFDAESHRDDILREVPSVDLTYKSSYDLIEALEYHEWHFHDLFDYNYSRSYAHLALRIIALSDPQYPEPYSTLIRILKDPTRPYLVWATYSDILKEFPGAIPYLFRDLEALTIGFRQLDKIAINDSLLKSSSDTHEAKHAESEVIRNELWIELFDLYIEYISTEQATDKRQFGDALGKIMLTVANRTFKNIPSNNYGLNTHKALKNRYDLMLKRLNYKMAYSDHYPTLYKPTILEAFLPGIVEFLKNSIKTDKLEHFELFSFNTAFTDLTIEIIRRVGNQIFGSQIVSDRKDRILYLIDDLLSILEIIIREFFTATEIEIKVYTPLGKESRIANRGINDFGFEIINWGYLLAQLHRIGKLQGLVSAFKDCIDIKATTSDSDFIYDTHNRTEAAKIYVFIKMILLAYENINLAKDDYVLEGLPVNETLVLLKISIQELALKYSADDAKESRLDVFDEATYSFGFKLYHQFLTNILYRCLNYFKVIDAREFLQLFFTKSIDLGRMFKAINMLDAEELKKAVSNRIEEVDVEKFIKSRFMITDLQYALVDAINSTDHWPLAIPIINKVQAHANRNPKENYRVKVFLYEINLLLAFKQRDFVKLQNLPMPEGPSYDLKEKSKPQKLKRYFIALFKIFNDKQYNEGIILLRQLSTSEPKNIRYAYQLYNAQMLKALHTNG